MSKLAPVDPEEAAVLLFDLAHAMRSPLLTLLGFTELARAPENTPEDLERTLAAIERSALRINRLVEDLVNLGRLQAPPPPPAPRALHLQRVLEELLRDARGSWSLRGIELVLEPPETEDDPRVCDERSLQIAVGALLRNAVEASPDQSEVRLRLLSTPSGRRIEIDDSGDSLANTPPEEVDRLFERFTRGPDRGDQPPGLGLGLALARRSASVLGASISLERTPSGGGRAILDLPSA